MKAETEMFEYFSLDFSSCFKKTKHLICRTLFACLYEFFKHHCLVCLDQFSVLAMKYNCLLFIYLLQQETFKVLFYRQSIIFL